MARPAAPLWLARPSRFAALDRSRALAALGVLVLLLAACLTALAAPSAGEASAGISPPAAQRDVYLYGSIVDGIRAGGDYYGVAASALRAGNFPLKPFFTFRLPTLAVVQAALPPIGVATLLYLLAILTVWAWFVRLREALSRPAAIFAAMIFLAGGMVAFVQPEIAAFHEIWAAQLIALSLALRRPDRWVEAVAVALMAMLVRETAALYVLVMAALAVIGGNRREVLGWGAALAVFAAVVAVHAMAVAQVVGPLDPASQGWGGLNGFGFFVEAIRLSTALQVAPLWLASLVLGLSLFGWAAWDSALALRVVATLLAYAALIAIAARTDTFYWALMPAPLVLVGLVFVPDALRDLARTILDRRRVTVQRITR